MRCRIFVSPAQKRNVTIDRRPPIKSIEICTSLKVLGAFRGPEMLSRTAELQKDSNAIHP
jgi:hypothetical protein